MKKIIFCKGLPASGKSSWAKDLVNKNPGKYKIVEKDILREMLDNGHYAGKNEKFILKIRDGIIIAALKEGYSIIVADSNFAPYHKKRIEELITEYKDLVGEVEIEEKYFDVEPEECIKRDLKRYRSVGADVIWDMYHKYVNPRKKYEDRDGLPYAVIFDIDNTLALKNGTRSPYDWSRVGEDDLNTAVADLIPKYREDGTHIFIFSGRDSVCRKETEDWLKKNNIIYDKLIMRSENDNRADDTVKEEFFNEYIKDKYNVKAVFDDRRRVCRLWWKLGLTVFRLGNPDDNF